MTSADVIARLPDSWHGLFAALRSPHNGIHLAEIWLQRKSSSRLNEAPQWQTLLSRLTEPEPQHRGSSLSFLPLFCLLPPDLQIKLLSVIYQHRCHICSSTLQTFVGVVHGHTEEGTWQGTLCDMLKMFLAESSKQREETDMLLTHYNFTQSNTALADQVCLQLLSSDSVTPWHTKTDVRITGIPVEEDNGTIPPLEDTSYSEHLHSKGPHQVSDAGLAREDLVPEDVIVLDDDDSLQDSPPEKRSKQTANATGVTIDEATTDHIDVQVDKTLQEKAGWLRELWQCSSLPDLDVSELNFLSGLPACQMKLLCNAVSVCSLPDGCLVLAFELLRRISPAVSYNSSVAFISGCFIPKFSDLDHPASRTLTGVLMNLAELFPKQLIDSLTDDSRISDMTSSQSDVLCRLCKESFNTESQAYLLRKLLSVCGVMNEHAVPVVSCVLESLDNLDETTTSIVFDCVHKSAQSLCQSLKFGKLMFSFVSKYGKSWTVGQQSVLLQAAELHKTFMKKSVLTALRRSSK